jgi:hypothetical protein
VKNWILVIAVAVVAAAAARELFPRTETIIIPGPSPEPVVVTVSGDSVELAHLRELVSRMEVDLRNLAHVDTVNHIDTVFVEDTIRLGFDVTPRWYLDSLALAQELGGQSIAQATLFGADSAGVYMSNQTLTYWTPGPLLGATSDSSGVQLLWGEFPQPKDTCEFWCKRTHEAVGGAVGIIIGVLLN